MKTTEMKRYGISGSEMKWFQDYLTGRRQRVCGGKEIGLDRCPEGVLQGSILGPLLFTMYVNDLPESVVQSKVKQYVDDSTMFYAADSDSELEEVLEKDLVGVARFGG